MKHKAEIRQDIAEFMQEVYKVQDEIETAQEITE